jgi:hypothetical protein
MSDDQCGKCKFYASTGEIDRHALNVRAIAREAAAAGVCRRFPPMMADPSAAQSSWPRVIVSEWCGEFAATGEKQ